MDKKLFFTLLFLLVNFSFSQESIMGSKERKYCSTYFLAEKHKVIEDYDAAAKYYEKCIELNPNEPAPFFELAKILFFNSELKAAEEFGLQALELDEGNKWYLYFLIQLYRYQYNLQKESAVWEKLILIEPSNSD